MNRLECADVQGNEKTVTDTDGVSEKLSAASGSSTEESRHAVRYRTCSWQKASARARRCAPTPRAER